MSPKRSLAGIVSIALTLVPLSAGPARAAGQAVSAASVKAAPMTGVAPVGLGLTPSGPASVSGAAAPVSLAPALGNFSASPSLVLPRPAAQVEAAGTGVEAAVLPPAAAKAHHAAPGGTAFSARVAGVSKSVGRTLSLPELEKSEGAEASRGAGDKVFSALSGQSLIETSDAGLVPAVSEMGRAGGRRMALSRRYAAPQEYLKPAAPPAPARPAASAPFRQAAAFKKGAAILGAAAFIAAAPFLAPHVGAVAAAGSILLSVIGIPQIVKNFARGNEAVKDLAPASALIWFGAATLLSIVSIGSGASLAWNAANVAGVIESAIVLGQINYHRRDAKTLKAAGAVVGASTLLSVLVALQIGLPLAAWLSVSFAGAMGLLWILNWPQISKNFKMFEAEGRPPHGIAPLYPALVTIGSLLHLYAAVMGGDVRWAINAVIAILTAGMVLAQIYFPKAANTVIGPLVRLTDALIPGAKAADPSAEARKVVEPLFSGQDMIRFRGVDPEGRMRLMLTKAEALPGRSVIFLEAPTAAGKSTLAKKLDASMGGRIKSLEVDRYFKSIVDVPRSANGAPDFDHPDSLNLDLVAEHVKTLLAGGRVELPRHDMASGETLYETGEFFELGENEVLVLDSIYAAHEKLLKAAEGRSTLNVYLTAPTTVRLARRLARDIAQRGIPAASNLKQWAGILDNERDHILPLRSKADIVVNLVTEKELEGLSAKFAGLLKNEWGKNGKNEDVTRLFQEMIRASLERDARTAD